MEDLILDDFLMNEELIAFERDNVIEPFIEKKYNDVIEPIDEEVAKRNAEFIKQRKLANRNSMSANKNIKG